MIGQKPGLFTRLFKPYLDRYLADYLSRFLPEYMDSYLSHFLLYKHLVFGDSQRLELASTAIVNNALFNVSSGRIIVRDYVFFGHNVSVLTGTHDYSLFNKERQESIPSSGKDIIIDEGAWIASNATIIGPCTIGAHAVVSAGSLVIDDVPSFAIVAGVPAKKIKEIKRL